MWDDGAITGALGLGLPGVPVARPRDERAVSVARAAGRLLMDWASVYESDALGELYTDAKAATKRGCSLREARASRRPTLPALRWQVQEADRDGRPRVRVAVLPRLRWPGMAVWDYCGAVGSSRGRYELVYRLSGRPDDATYEASGLRFGTLAALWAHLGQA